MLGDAQDGKLTAVFMGSGYYAAQEKECVPKLSPTQLEAMRFSHPPNPPFLSVTH